MKRIADEIFYSKSRGVDAGFSYNNRNGSLIIILASNRVIERNKKKSFFLKKKKIKNKTIRFNCGADIYYPIYGLFILSESRFKDINVRTGPDNGALADCYCTKLDIIGTSNYI